MEEPRKSKIDVGRKTRSRPQVVAEEESRISEEIILKE